MYYSEKLTPEMIRQIQAGEDRRSYKTAGSRIVFARNCEHCEGEYYPRVRTRSTVVPPVGYGLVRSGMATSTGGFKQKNVKNRMNR